MSNSVDTDQIITSGIKQAFRVIVVAASRAIADATSTEDAVDLIEAQAGVIREFAQMGKPKP